MTRINGKRIKFQWYCEKNDLVSIFGFPKDCCTRACEHLIKTSLGRGISRELREKIYKRDGYKCIVCEKSKHNLTIDHLIPIDKGGTNDEWNLATMCSNCNCAKGNKLIDRFVELSKELKTISDNINKKT